MQQVICMRCGAQFRVAGAGPVYCPNCGVLLGPAPAAGAAPAQATPGPSAGPGAFPPPAAPIRMASPAPPAASPMPGAAPPTTPLPPGGAQPGVAPPGYAPPSAPLGSNYGMPGAATSPLYGYSAVAAASQVAVQASARRRRRTWLLVTTLALLVVLVVAGSGVVLALAAQSQPSTTAGQGSTSAGPTPAITVPAGFVEFTDPGGVFACGVPSGWVQVSSTAGNVTSAAFGSASLHATLSAQYTTDNSLSEADLDDQLLQSLPATLHNGQLANVAKGSAAIIGRETWAVKTADLTYSADSGSVTLHVVVMTASHDVTAGGSSTLNLFSLIAMAPASSFDTINRQDFAPLEASFTFLR